MTCRVDRSADPAKFYSRRDRINRAIAVGKNSWSTAAASGVAEKNRLKRSLAGMSPAKDGFYGSIVDF